MSICISHMIPICKKYKWEVDIKTNNVFLENGNIDEKLNYSDYDYWLLDEIEAYRVTNRH